jgi:hypothetical protein
MWRLISKWTSLVFMEATSGCTIQHERRVLKKVSKFISTLEQSTRTLSFLSARAPLGIFAKQSICAKIAQSWISINRPDDGGCNSGPRVRTKKCIRAPAMQVRIGRHRSDHGRYCSIGKRPKAMYSVVQPESIEQQELGASTLRFMIARSQGCTHSHILDL